MTGSLHLVAAFIAAIGVLGHLLGVEWMTSWVPGWIGMHEATALSLLVCAAMREAMLNQRFNGRSVPIVGVCAVFVEVVVVSVSIRYMQSDAVQAAAIPGPVNVPALPAVCTLFCLSCLSLAGMAWVVRMPRAVHWIGGVVILSSGLVIVGYLTGQQWLMCYSDFGRAHVAAPTAVALFLLGWSFWRHR